MNAHIIAIGDELLIGQMINTNARFSTVLKVFNALNAKVNFTVELEDQKLMLSE